MKAGYKPQTVKGALEYIISQKGSRGHYGSTQTTVLSLKALVYAAEHFTDVKGKATVTVYLNGEQASVQKFDETNSDVVRMLDLGSASGQNTVEIKMEGDGNLYYQVTTDYYSPWAKGKAQDGPLKIDVAYNTTTLRVNDLATVKVKLTYSGKSDLGMTIVDLGVPPGFSVVSEDLDLLKKARTIDRYDVSGRQLIIYVPGIRAGEQPEFSYGIRANYPVRAMTPESTAYEYYNPSIRDVAQPTEVNVGA
jgi:hypothetical protein